MATTAQEEKGIVLELSGKILGPGSPYEESRLVIQKEYAPILAAAKEVSEVKTFEAKEQAIGLSKLLLLESRKVGVFYKVVKVQIDAIKNPVLKDEHADYDQLVEQKSRLDKLCLDWILEQEKLKAEADRKANEALQKQALEDAEKKRNDILSFAAEVELSGDKEQSETLVEEALSVEPEYIPPVVTQSAPKSQGEVRTYDYTAVVDDVKQLLQGIIDGKIPMTAITVNQAYLNRRAKDEKEGFAIPGCSYKKTPKMHTRL